MPSLHTPLPGESVFVANKIEDRQYGGFPGGGGLARTESMCVRIFVWLLVGDREHGRGIDSGLLAWDVDS